MRQDLADLPILVLAHVRHVQIGLRNNLAKARLRLFSKGGLLGCPCLLTDYLVVIARFGVNEDVVFLAVVGLGVFFRIVTIDLGSVTLTVAFLFDSRNLDAR